MLLFICFFLSLARAKWQLGSLSHYVNSEAKGYQSLPDFPDEPPDVTERDVEVNTCTCSGKYMYMM